MEWLIAAVKELFSLFVDDVPYSVAIIVWIITGTVLLPALHLNASVQALLLFLGFALILLVSVLLSARQSGSH